MIQEAAFDPASGAPLSLEKEYPGTFRTGARTPEEHADAIWDDSREGALTNGELYSSGNGLIGYFRRVHRKEFADPDPARDRAAATAIRQLKSAKDDAGNLIGDYVLDCILWYLVAERLATKGHDATWMLHYAIPRCPKCDSELKFRPGVGALEGVCASSPNRHGAVDDDIRERVQSLYQSVFDEGRDLAVL